MNLYLDRIARSKSPWVSVDQSLFYVNNLIEGFSQLNPIVHCNGAKVIKNSGGLRGGHVEDFDFIRSFDKIMISTALFRGGQQFLARLLWLVHGNRGSLTKVREIKTLGEPIFLGGFPGAHWTIYICNQRR